MRILGYLTNPRDFDYARADFSKHLDARKWKYALFLKGVCIDIVNENGQFNFVNRKSKNKVSGPHKSIEVAINSIVMYSHNDYLVEYEEGQYTCLG